MSNSPATFTSTYRLQFNAAFTFQDAERIVPYLAKLGIDVMYASPYFQARPGSTHGYDVVDHNRFNPEIGDAAAHSRMIARSQAHGIAHLLDFVPNHMGIGNENLWWRDVLVWGESSPYAHYFDINWQPAKPELQGRVLLPKLGDLYGAVLERGELTLEYLPEQGEFQFRYVDNTFPMRLTTYTPILEEIGRQSDVLNADLQASMTHIIDEFREHGDTRERSESLRSLIKDVFKTEAFGHALEKTIAHYTVRAENDAADNEQATDKLDQLLSDQNYRLTYWRLARDEINYRRFFDINDLAGLRVEDVDTFADTHRLIFELINQGLVQGMRIDHIDGLRDPSAYCSLLRSREMPGVAPLYIVVEKILARFENLVSSWGTDGTTGYEFSGFVCGLSVDERSEERFSKIYRSFSGLERDFNAVAHEAKRLVMRTMLASEMTVLATLLERIAASDRRSIDFTFASLRDALTEVTASFPIYRTYVMNGQAAGKDLEYIEWAVKLAKKYAGSQDEKVYDFLFDVLTLRLLEKGGKYDAKAVLTFVHKFQQYTSPVMAKSVEDTAFYRYVRLLSLNEVGGDPARFGASVNEFHRFAQDRAAKFPKALSATATHDHKRGEDVRTRLNALSEMPDVWAKALRAFTRTTERWKAVVHDVPAPSANDEYALYQTLLGTWPCEWLDGAPIEAADREKYALRIEAYMQKFVREAKLRSSWANQDEAYEKALADFSRRLLDPVRAAAFQRVFLETVKPLARIGMASSLIQLAIKHIAPGVPDLYQGCEFWDLTMVDPDNRGAVDFELRDRLLGEFESALETKPAGEIATELLSDWKDGRIKFFVLWRLLQIRKQYADVLLSNLYKPLKATGRKSRHAIAFMRGDIVFVAPRLLRRLLDANNRVVCNEVNVIIPKAAARYRDLITDEVFDVEADTLRFSNLFKVLPFAILVPCE